MRILLDDWIKFSWSNGSASAAVFVLYQFCITIAQYHELMFDHMYGLLYGRNKDSLLLY